MRPTNLHFLALPIAIGSIALAACGGDSPGGSGGTKADFREAALKHARCMREHGVDVPDPKPGPDGGMRFEMRDDGGDKLKVKRAEDACRKYLEDVRPPELSPEEERKFREDALKHARCMREHGIDMPDPTFGKGGGVQQGLGSDVGPDNPRFEAAEKACAKYGPDFGLTKAGGK